MQQTDSNRTMQMARRLILQAEVYDSLTRRLLVDAGIRHGMRVLDIGSGPGTVSSLLSALVGRTGAVVGVEHDEAMLEIARCRTPDANVSFVRGDIETLDLIDSFDAIIGRFVLRELRDPTRTLARLSRLLTPGGIVAFHEKVLAIPVASFPELPLIRQVCGWMDEARRRAHTEMTTGTRLDSVFLAAGLPAPELRFEAPVHHGSHWAGYAYLTEALRGMMPVIRLFGIADDAQIDVETLEPRMRLEAAEARAALVLTPCVGAWTRTP